MVIIKNNKRAQVTIFIIIAIVIVAIVLAFLSLRKTVTIEQIPASIEPVYTSFLSCLEEDALVGIDVLESQAGYIYVPDFEPGSTYMPFSSQLDFLGNPVPYWYYVSGNNIQKEQVPSKSEMENQLGDFIENKIDNCRFDTYYEQGFEISLGEPEAEVSIKDSDVEIDLDMNLNIVKEEDSAVVGKHKVVVSSRLGALYDSAKLVYEKEQNELFLERYAVDTLRAYAPVDGVELTCSPKVWNADEVFDELEDAIEINTLSLKSSGKPDDYFVIDVGVETGVDVRFINSKQWPHGFEVDPSEGPVLIANPTGNQPGLGVMGFCYVPYHFVYNVRYPVLVQVQEGDEIFQFPVAIVLQGNNPRKALDVSAVELEIPELCEHKNTFVKVNTYDTNLNFVDADISYECFSTRCSIGKTSSGFLEAEFPQCVNGVVIAKAEGFKEARTIHTTTNGEGVDIILDKLYELDVGLKLDGKNYNKEAIISFVSDDFSRTIIYPEQKTLELAEGQYEIQVQVYKTSTLKISSTISEQCMEVPRSGLGGLLGLTRQECFDIGIPAQDVERALAGGGQQNYYILEGELSGSNTIEINAGSLPTPKTLEQLQDNYVLFEGKGLDIVFK